MHQESRTLLGLTTKNGCVVTKNNWNAFLICTANSCCFVAVNCTANAYLPSLSLTLDCTFLHQICPELIWCESNFSFSVGNTVSALTKGKRPSKNNSASRHLQRLCKAYHVVWSRQAGFARWQKKKLQMTGLPRRVALWPRLKLVALRWSLSAEQFVGPEQGAVRLTTDFSKQT